MQSKKRPLLAIALIALITVQACNVPSWVNTAESYIRIILPVAVNLVSVLDPTLSPLASEIVQAVNALLLVLDGYKAQPTASNLQRLQATLATLNANVDQLSTAARIHNPQSETRIKAIIQLITSMVQEIAAQIPTGPTLTARKAPRPMHKKEFYVQQYNQLIAGDPRFTPLHP